MKSFKALFVEMVYLVFTFIRSRIRIGDMELGE